MPGLGAAGASIAATRTRLGEILQVNIAP